MLRDEARFGGRPGSPGVPSDIERKNHVEDMHRRTLAGECRHGCSYPLQAVPQTLCPIISLCRFRFALLARWKGTVLPALIQSPMMWAAVLGYVGCAVLTGEAINDTTGVIGQSVSFILIFYASYNFSRADLQHTHSIKCMNAVLNLAFLDADVTRYLNAALMLAFMNISDVLSLETCRELNNTYQLLSQEEWALLQEQDLLEAPCCVASHAVLGWAIKGIEKVEQKGRISHRLCCIHVGVVNTLQDELNHIHGQYTQPVPFVYGHLLYTLTWLYLVLFACVLGFNQDGEEFGITLPLSFTVGLITVVVNNTFFICLLTVGQQMGEPFGHDLIDFEIVRFIKQTIWMSACSYKAQSEENKNDPQAWIHTSCIDVFGSRSVWSTHRDLKAAALHAHTYQLTQSEMRMQEMGSTPRTLKDHPNDELEASSASMKTDIPQL